MEFTSNMEGFEGAMEKATKLGLLRAAEFLHGICGRSRSQPAAVVLGHLSEDCNKPHLPVKEIEAYFGRRGLPVRFKTHVSPRSVPGELLIIK